MIRPYLNVKKIYSRFFRSRAGNVAITFALATVPLIGAVGAAVDYSRANSAKAALQISLDATALMLVKEAANVSNGQLMKNGTAYFLANFSRPDAYNKDIKVTANSSTSTLQVDGSATIDTIIAGIVGVNTINLTGTSVAAWGQGSMIRVAMVLDNTGSMSSDGKMTAMKTATKNLLAKLKSGAKINGDVVASIVPFAKDVNLGKNNVNSTAILWDDGTDKSWDGSKGTCSAGNYSPRSACQSSGMTCSIPGYTKQDDCEEKAGVCSNSGYTKGSDCVKPGICSNSSYDKKEDCEKYGACSNSSKNNKGIDCIKESGSCSNSSYDKYDDCVKYGVCSISKYNNKPDDCVEKGGKWTASYKWTANNTWTPSYVWTQSYNWTHGTWGPGGWTPASHSLWSGCVVDRGDASGPSSGNYDTNVVAPQTGVPATLYVPEDYSSCPQPSMGLTYDWVALNKLVDDMSPAGNTNQAIGLQLGWMTLTSNQPLPGPTKNSGVEYSDHIILLTDGLNTQNRWYSSQSQIDNRQTVLCNNIKAAKITLWTIQVNTGGDPTSTMLRDCASDPSKFFLLTTANQIITTFDEISFKIVKLHLAK